MHVWINFWNLIFWFSLMGFLINNSNFLFLFLFSETTWLILYTYSVFLSSLNDDINLASNTFFILGLAGLEFAIGFLLLIVFKNLNMSINLIEHQNIKNNLNRENPKNLNLLIFFWKS